MLHLPDVALVVVDTVCPELTALAVSASCSKVKFGRVDVWTNKPDLWWGSFAHQHEIHLWESDASCFNDVGKIIWEVVPDVISKKYVLIQHWDSWVLNPEMWDDNFLAYDYIGAPWGFHTDGNQVGNGGFSLRSMRLIKKVAEHKLWRFWGQPEDAAVCRINHHVLRGEYAFAPVPSAARFSFERTHYAGPGQHFGFHGVFNFKKVMSPDEFEKRMHLVHTNEYLANKLEVRELINEQKK